MKKDALCVTGINFLATMIRPLSPSMSPGIQNHKHFSIGIQKILLPVACILWMNFAFSQPIVKVIGSKDSVAVLKQVTQCMEYLVIRENVRITIIFPSTMSKNYAGFTICVNDPGLKKDTDYLIVKVYLDGRQPKSLQRIVLAHEMIHVKQYAKGELSVNSRQEVIWKGQKHFWHGVDEGDPPPWEREAFRDDARLVKHCKKQNDILLPVSKADAYVAHDPSQKQISDFQQKY
jgi:hypothetical protein